MRKIESVEEKEKKQRRNQLILGAGMIFLLVLSTAGFALLNHDTTDTTQTNSPFGLATGEKITINGQEFTKQGELWVIELNNRYNAFYNLPSELDDVTVNVSTTIGSLVNQPLYFTEINTVADHIFSNLYPDYVLRANSACVTDVPCLNETYPIKDCATNNIIIFKETSEATKVYEQDKCIFIEGDIIKGGDAFLYKVLTIQ